MIIRNVDNTKYSIDISFPSSFKLFGFRENCKQSQQNNSNLLLEMSQNFKRTSKTLIRKLTHMNPVFGSSEKNAYCKLTFLTLKVHAPNKVINNFISRVQR